MGFILARDPHVLLDSAIDSLQRVLSPIHAEIGKFWIDTDDRVLARIDAAGTKLVMYSVIRTVAIRLGPAINTTRIVDPVQKALGPGDWRYQMVNSALGEQFPSIARMIRILEEYTGQWGSMMSAAIEIFDQEIIARARLDRSIISLRKGGWVTGETMDVLTSIELSFFSA